MSEQAPTENVRETVRQRYAAQALRVIEDVGGSCCGSACGDEVTRDLYTAEEIALIPKDAVRASLGCGNPTALADLQPGQSVLDLGSGGGIDVLLTARRVSPTGFAYGVDMTDEMLSLAEANRVKAGATNVRFLKGHIEEIPLPEAAVDVVISNCVINLSADKPRVLREAFRVLRPGGQFAVSDVVVQGEMPAELRKDMEAWVGCVAGALEEGEYRNWLAAAGFEDIDIEVTRVHDPADLMSAGGCCCGPVSELTEIEGGGRVVSAFVRARKPDPA